MLVLSIMRVTRREVVMLERVGVEEYGESVDVFKPLWYLVL